MERFHITSFKSLQIALKELKPFIRNLRKNETSSSLLESGRPLKKFGGMLPRELLANWLLVVAANYAFGRDRFTFTSDPKGGDGLIHDAITAQGVWTEHVMVRGADADDKQDAQTRILKAVAQKQAKGGAAYARGKTLIVFMFSGTDGARWWPNRVANALAPHDFDAVWVVGFQYFSNGARVYAVTRLEKPGSPVWWVRIAQNFDNWTVSEIAPLPMPADIV